MEYLFVVLHFSTFILGTHTANGIIHYVNFLKLLFQKYRINNADSICCMVPFDDYCERYFLNGYSAYTLDSTVHYGNHIYSILFETHESRCSRQYLFTIDAVQISIFVH